MIAFLQRTLGVDQDVSDVLDVAHLPLAAPHFEQRIVGGRFRIGGVEQQHPTVLRAEAGGELPVFALDVVDDDGARPGQQGWDDEADTLAGSGRSKTQNMLRSVVAKIVTIELTEDDAVRVEQARRLHLLRLRPSSRAIGFDVLLFAGAPHRHAYGDRDGDEAA